MLIKTLLATRKPLLCAGLYGAALFTNGLMFDLAFGGTWGGVLYQLVGATGLSFAFFWLLRELESSGAPYWTVLILGSGCLLFFF